MSEAVLDNAIEQIADGLTVDWNAIDKAGPSREREWAKSLRVLNDIVRLHREAAADYEQTTLVNAAPRSASASDTWGKYRLADKVGEGSYGAVYRAWDSELERDVAIKILHQRVGDTRLKERLLQEGRALAKIRHNNVVNVLGIEAHADRVGLCMEFVRGKTLADVVRSGGKMSAAEAVLVGQDLCRALSAVHRAGYIHRDVKAKNVMRDDTGRIVLMDFGTGRTAETQENKNDRAGTPLYMAPEVLDGGTASARSDVYSLGVLLYNLVTGDYPVRANSVDELRDAHTRREHRWLSELRPDLPVAFMQVVERAIALDADERYPNSSELLAALSSLKIGTRPVWLRIAKPVIVVAGIVVGMTALGALTSAIFNVALERSAFAEDTFADYFVWGRRTSFMPFMVLLVVCLIGTLLQASRRLLIALSGGARRIDASIRRRGRETAHRFQLDEAPVLAGCVLLMSVAVLTVACWHFSPLLLAISKYVSTASSRDLQLLSPDSVYYHNQYRQVFTGVVLVCIVAWYPVWRLVKKGQSLFWGMWVGGAVVTCMALFFLHFPYRLLIYRNYFDLVRWNDVQCAVIGERESLLLLYCPQLSLPRMRTVNRNEESLVALGRQTRLFQRF
jgi:RIO-like serine/threonine protein kinase